MAKNWKPIIFCPALVNEIWDDRKTQTRRLVMPQPAVNLIPVLSVADDWQGWEFVDRDCIVQLRPKQYRSGDKLWVRETHYRYGEWVKNGITPTGRQKWEFKPTEDGFAYEAPKGVKPYAYREKAWYKRPSIFMPKSAAQLFLEVTDVRVEKLQDISTSDIIKEGVYPNMSYLGSANQYRHSFIGLWDELHKKRGYRWDANPTVWVNSFRVIDD